MKPFYGKIHPEGIGKVKTPDDLLLVKYWCYLSMRLTRCLLCQEGTDGIFLSRFYNTINALIRVTVAWNSTEVEDWHSLFPNLTLTDNSKQKIYLCLTKIVWMVPLYFCCSGFLPSWRQMCVLFFSFFVMLWFELRACTLSHSTSPVLCWVFFFFQDGVLWTICLGWL
jgi:hypothetical protein